MATSPKDPRFPHPALEVGVPQYPTPNVPDFYTKNGHIILVVKENVEKGKYNPRPLDGSITYSGRDANKWPTPLYLVYQQPTPDGQYVYNTYANDRTLASQDPWNYGLDYSGNNPSYPITSRTYIVPRSQYSTVALGSTDPVFGGTQIIAQQKMAELPDDNPLRSRYVQVQRVYESVPGPVITGKRLDPRGDIETVEVQTVTAGTAPTADGLLVTETKVDFVDSVKSTKTTATVQSYATLTTKANKAGLQGDTSTTDDIVSPSTNPDELSTTVLESTVEQLTATKARKRTTTSSGPTELDSKEKKSGLLGETTIAQSIVSYGSSPDNLSTSVVSSSVDAIDQYKSKKTTITSTGPTSLTGDEKKAGLLGITETIESIVAAGAAPDDLSTTVLQSTVTPIDSAKSKKTTTTASGPNELSGVAKKGGLLGEVATTESIVAYGSSADNLSTTVLQSEVTPIDSAKSKKTTVEATGPTELNGKEYKAGLLGKTIKAESIVEYGSSPDELSTTILDSSVEPIDAYKSKKTTITATGPTSLAGKTKKAGLLGETDAVESIVAAGSNPDSLTTSVISSEVTPIDEYKSKKITITSTGPISLTGDENKAGLLGITETVETIVASGASPDALSTSVLQSIVTPIDSAKSKKTTTTASGPTSLNSKQYRAGLLGETQKVESIVAYDSDPDSLSTTILDSSVEAIDVYKSKKTTITSTGPNSLTSPANKAGLLGQVSVVESIVEAGSSADSLSTTVLSSEITAIDSAKSKKTTVTATGPTELIGKSKKAGLLGEVSISEEIVSYGTDADDLTTSVVSSEVTPIDAYKSKKTTATSSGPSSLGGVATKPGLLGLTSTTETIVAAGSAADALSTTVLQSEVTPIDSAKSKKTTTESSGPTELDGKTIGEFGYITTAESIVQYSAGLPTPDTSTIKLEKSPIDDAKAKLVNASYDGLSILSGYQYDADLNVVIENTKEIVSPGTALTYTNGLISSRDEPQDIWKTIRIQSKISSLPSERTEYKTGSYGSPNLLTGFDNSFFVFPDGQIQYNVTPVMRAKRSYQTAFKYQTSYQYGQPTAPGDTLFDPLAINVYYDGYFFKVNIPDCLTDSGLSINFSTGTGNASAAYYGPINETYTVPTTTLRATAYKDLVGSYQLISYEIDYWKANIWRTSKQYVLLK